MVGYVGPPGLSGGNSRIDVGCPRSGQWPAMHPARTQCAVRRRWDANRRWSTARQPAGPRHPDNMRTVRSRAGVR